MPKSRSIDITEGFLKTENIDNTYGNSSILTVKGNLTIEGGLTFPDNTLQTTAYTGGGITVQDEGTSLSTTATTLNFVGSGVVASGTGSTKTITISGGGVGGGEIFVHDEGTPLDTAATILDFVGAGVVASGTGSTKTITVSDTNTTYAVSAVDSGDNAIIRLAGSDSSIDDVTLVAGTDITITPAGDNITIASTAQPTLVSGTNIKSVNSTTLLGSGNLDVQPTLVSGTNIKSVNGTTLLGSGDITVSDTNTTYAISAETATGGVNLRLTGSDASTDDVKLAQGSNITLTRTDANTITIASTGFATETYVNTAVSNLVDSAPATLDTLNELAAALGDDPNYATTITTSLSGKQPTLVSGTNIKTVNNNSLLGSGNLSVQETLVSGTNIKTINGTTLLGSGDITTVQDDAIDSTKLKSAVNLQILNSSGGILKTLYGSGS